MGSLSHFLRSILSYAPQTSELYRSIGRKTVSKSLLHIDIGSLLKSRYFLHAKIDLLKLTCDQALFFSRRCSQRKNERLIQLLVESSVKSPESGLFSDWSGNKRQFAQMFAHFVPASRLCWFPPTKRLPVNCDWLTLIWWHRWHSRWQTL